MIRKLIVTPTHYCLSNVFRGDAYFAVGTQDGEIYIWETQSLTLYKKYENNCGGVRVLCYSPDGQKLALGTDNGTFQVLDVQTGTLNPLKKKCRTSNECNIFSGLPVFSKIFTSRVSCLKWQGKILTLGNDAGLLQIWDMFEVKELLEVEVHSGNYTFCNILKPSRVYILGAITTVDISKDNNIIVTGSQDRSIKVWVPKVEHS